MKVKELIEILQKEGYGIILEDGSLIKAIWKGEE